MSDNVTPFRRPPPRPRQRSRFNLQSHRGKAVFAQALTLTAFALAFAFPSPPLYYLGLAVGIGAFAVAHSNRGDGMPWARTHHAHVVRTLLLGSSLLILLSLVYLFPQLTQLPYVKEVLFWARLAIYAWAGLRALIGLGLAIIRRPIPNVRGFVI
jgi:hypothetical protein